MNDLPSALASLLPPDLLDACQTECLPKGARLFHVGEPPQWMFYVGCGEVVLERTSDDGGALVLQRQFGGFVAEASLQSSHYHCDARVTVAAQITRVPVRRLREALEGDSAFAMRWISMLNAELRRVRQQCERLSMRRVHQRLLHWLATSPGGRFNGAGGLKSLAAELGVTHEALYRCLAELEARGQVRREAQGGVSLVRG